VPERSAPDPARFGGGGGAGLVRSVGEGVLVDHDDSVTNWLTARPGLTDPLGNLRLGAVTFVADGAGGLACGLACPEGRWVVTTDLEVRLVRPITSGRVRIHGRTVRAGATTVVATLDLTDDATGEALGTGSITSHSLETPTPPPRDLWPRGTVLARTEDPPDTPVLDLVAATTAGPGVVELPVTDEVRNPWGILHGGMAAFLAEAAVQAHPAGAGRPCLGMLLRYLAPTRTGPARFEAEHVGSSVHGGVFRVRGTDVGAGGRLTVVATVTTG